MEPKSTIKLGEIVENWVVPSKPHGISLKGNSVILQPLSCKDHATQLFSENKKDQSDAIWTYLPYGPFTTLAEYYQWLKSVESLQDPCFFAIHCKIKNKACGVASYLRIRPDVGCIEVGHINFSPTLQATMQATEAMYLMMKWAFDNGYRRYEWKCNALNIKSRRAAQRLGFSYEGIFRQESINKDRNRDTAWFAIIDKEWRQIKKCFEIYLSSDNFDDAGRQRQSLSFLTRKLLYKVDSMECC